MRVLLYPQIYGNTGTGNVLRSSYLYTYLTQRREIEEVHLATNDSGLAGKVLASIGTEAHIETIGAEEIYDVIVHDYLQIDSNLLRELRAHTRCLIALDFREYEKNGFDIIINLYSHNPKELPKFRGQLYQGLQYGILKPEVIRSKRDLIELRDNKKPNVLITFGGEDPTSNTLKILRTINCQMAQIKVLLGPLNKDKKKIIQDYNDKVEILEPIPYIGKIMAESDLVICGGGTTLLEAIYLGNPIIAVPQNELEMVFVDYIKKQVPIFSEVDIPSMLEKCKDIEFRRFINDKYTTLIDGGGLERITEIILKGVRV